MVSFFSLAQETGDRFKWACMLVDEKHDDYMVAEGYWEKNITNLALGTGWGGGGTIILEHQ